MFVIIPRFEKEGLYCFSSVRPTVRNQYFSVTPLSATMHHSPSNFLYGALAMDPTCCLPNKWINWIYDDVITCMVLLCQRNT